MPSSPVVTQPAQLINNSLSRCVISLLSALKSLGTAQSQAKALANDLALLAGHSLSNQNYRLASGGISCGVTPVPPLLVFCFSLKSITTTDTNTLYDVSGEDKIISNVQNWLRHCSKIPIVVSGLKCIDTLVTAKLLHLRLLIVLLGLAVLPICLPIVLNNCTTPQTLLPLQNCWIIVIQL